MRALQHHTILVALAACSTSEPIPDEPLEPCTGKCDGADAWFAGSIRRVASPSAGARYGHALANAGDVDDDGHDDLVIGEPGTTRGRVYVYSGRLHTLLYSIDGEGGAFGHSLAGVDDLDRDGVRDIAVGAPSGGGLVYLYSAGQPRKLIRRVGGIGTRSLGESLANVGDIDGDGVDDFAAGGSDYNQWCTRPLGATGFVQVYSGQTGRLLQTVEGFKYDRLGAAIASAGDLNFDDVPDLVVGSPQEGYYDRTGGAVVALSGSMRGKVCGEYNQRPSGIFVAKGWYLDELGTAVAAVGDIDGDDVGDIAAGAPGEGGAVVWLLSGATGDPLSQLVHQHDFGESRFGQGLAAVGDVDGDRVPDVAVGLHRSVEVHSGATGALLARYPRREVGWITSNGWLTTLSERSTGCRKLVVSGEAGHVTYLPLPCPQRLIFL